MITKNNLAALIYVVTSIFISIAFTFMGKIYLEGDDFKLYLVLMMLISIVPLLDFGLSPTYIREETLYRDKKIADAELIEKVSSFSELFFVAGSLSLIAALIFGSTYIVKFNSLVNELHIIVLSVGVFVAVYGNFFYAEHFAQNRIIEEKIYRLIPNVIWVCVTFHIFQAGYPWPNLIFVWTAILTISRGFVLFSCGRNIYYFLPSIRKKTASRRQVNDALKWFLMSVGSITAIQAPFFLVAQNATDNELFILDLLLKPVLASATLFAAFSAVAQPKISSSFGASDGVEFNHQVSKLERFGFFFLLLVILGYLILSMLLLIFTHQDSNTLIFLSVVFSIFLIVEAFTIIKASVVMATGKVVFGGTSIFYGLISFSFSAFLDPWIGVSAVPLGMLLGLVSTNYLRARIEFKIIRRAI